MTYSTVVSPLFYPVGSAVRSNVICDWLDVTCSPECSFFDALDNWLCGNGIPVKYSDPSSSTYTLDAGHGVGTLRVDTKFNFHRASASGVFLSALRAVGLYRDYINVLGLVPHKVTRLDAALDVGVDAPAVLAQLCAGYGGSFSFGRKALRTKTIFETRLSDGATTGTWYAGHLSKARVSCRVYDKQQERLIHGKVIPPLTRYEITFRKDYGCSLWDALMPKSIFYSHSSDLVEPPTEGYDTWSSRGLVPWVSEPVDTDLTFDKFARAVEYSVEFRYLAERASRFGPEGKALVLGRIEALLDGFIRESTSDTL
jgi:hypothetical protein